MSPRGKGAEGRTPGSGGEADEYVADLYRSLGEDRADLLERVKELRCLYAVDRALRRADEDWAGALQAVVDLIPPGFQFPEITAACLRLEGETWTSEGFRATDQRLSETVPAPEDDPDAAPGVLEVFLLGDPPDPGRPRFLPEEDHLLEALAGRIGEAWRGRVRSGRVRLLAAALHAAGPVLITDREGVIEWVNPAFTEVTGYTFEESVGRTPGELLGSEIHDEAFYRELWETILAGETWRGRTINRYKDGRLHPEDQRITPIRGSDGEITHFVAMKVDVTERLRAEEEQRRLLTVIDTAPDLVGMSDLEGRALYINRSGRELVGLGPDEDLGNRHVSTFHPEWAARRLVEEGVPTALREGRWSGECALLGPDGEEIPVWQRIILHRDRDGEPEFLATVMRDLREEKRRSARLHFQATVLDAVGEGIMATDLDGRIVYWNRAAEEMFGWSAEELIGRDGPALLLPDEERELGESVLRHLLAGEPWTGDIEYLRKDGTSFTAHVTATPTRDPEGTIEGVVGVISDVTEQRDLEARFRQASKMEAVGRLAGGVAHDFNNLLTVIQGHVQMMMDDVPGESPMADDLRQVLKEVDRAASLTRQLLAFSRRQVLIEKTLDLGRSVAEMEPMLRRFIPERIALEFDIVEGPSLVRADPVQLHQVVLNLAVNATHAIEDGGTIRFVVERVDLSADDAERIPWHVLPGSYVSLVVQDTGAGMPPEVRERIFEPFFTTKPEGEGTGLGLSMVFGIVKQSGGHILVESEPGAGSRFELLLPRAEGDAAEPGPAEAEARQSGRADATDGEGVTVLLVEDEAAVRAVTKRALERWGCEVVVAPNGEEALRIAADRGEELSVVISDIVMPEMGGAELVDLLRERLPQVPIVLMSGYSEEELAVGVRHKATAFLEKPFSPDVLIRTVRGVLSG